MTPVIPAGSGAAVAGAAAALRRPGAVALVPTETVYGLVCRWADPAGVDRIYELKDRDRAKPLAMFGRCAADLEAAGGIVTRAAAALIARFCPGPVTLIVAGRGGGTVGFRTPDHPFVLRLLEELGFPLASTSANRSGAPNALTAAGALAMLDGAPDVAVDGGPIAPGSLASTVIDLSTGEVKILREGPVGRAAVDAVLEAL